MLLAAAWSKMGEENQKA